MTHYDVIVIGAGPAGAAAAYRLARGGSRVALLEKHRLPRHKTCGGGMPMTVGSLLEFATWRDLAPEAFVECDVRWMRHTYRFADPHLASINTDAAHANGTERALWMVQRAIFDNALAMRAAQAGADLRDGLTVRELDVPDSPTEPLVIRAESASGTWTATADSVVAADGANGITARLVGLRRSRALAIAMELEVPHDWLSTRSHPDLRPDVCHLEYGAVRGGYAWVFPKRDHLNVGAGVFRVRRGGRGDANVSTELRRAMADYLRSLGIPQPPDTLPFHAHPLPIWDGLDTLQTRGGRVLLTGDAAGLVNPFFGDGILHALTSGQIAARCLLENRRAEYQRDMKAQFAKNFDAAASLAKIFYQWPGFVYRHGIRRPNATPIAMSLLSGEMAYSDLTGRVRKRLRDALRRHPHENAEATGLREQIE